MRNKMVTAVRRALLKFALKQVFNDPELGALAVRAKRVDATMAGAPVTQTPAAQPAMDTVRVQLNQLIDDVELFRAAFVLHQHAALNAAPSTNAIIAANLKASKVNL